MLKNVNIGNREYLSVNNITDEMHVGFEYGMDNCKQLIKKVQIADKIGYTNISIGTNKQAERDLLFNNKLYLSKCEFIKAHPEYIYIVTDNIDELFEWLLKKSILYIR
jgi:hypothetical protein